VTAIFIRPAEDGELDLILSWAAAEGWNPGRDDARPFLAADPEGFLIGFVEGAAVSCISVVEYGEDYGFLGFYICRPEFRGRGHGMAIWNAGIARLGGRTIGLDGVVAQQANYAKSGFALAHRNIRFGGPASASEIGDPRLVEVGAARPIGLAGAIVAYDRELFPAPRNAFLRAWLDPSGRRTLAFIENNQIHGYGCVRPCGDGYKVGPLFADSGVIAESLFTALTARLRGSRIFLDIPEPNEEARRLAERHGLAPVFETARMYRGQPPALPLDRIFGITSFELG
jgi:hypothetical protein